MKNRPGYRFLLIILFFMSSGCDKKEAVTCIKDCMGTYLQQHRMVAYKGGETGCKFFLSLYEFQNKQYYVLGNHCADMASNPTDCSGNTLCASGEEKVCQDFFQNAKYIGIVGIEA